MITVTAQQLELLIQEELQLLQERSRLKQEKIRSDKFYKFNLEEFQALGSDIPKLMAYIEKTGLKFLGIGSSRAVFVLSSKNVLKVAHGSNGNAQNQSEVEVYENFKFKPVVAAVNAAGKDFAWIISEIARPVKRDEFEKFTGIAPENLHILAQSLSDSSHGLYRQQAKELFSTLSSEKKNWIRSILELKLANELEGDIEKLSSYGKTADGRIVMLDYGLTSDVWQKHYSP